MYKMAAPATEQIQLAQSSGQSAWNHAVKTFGDMGQQTAGANGSIKMTGGKRQRQSKRQSRRQSKQQSHKGGKRQSRKQSRRHSQRQRGGRR